MPAPAPRPKVLVVDDHEVFRLGMRHLLAERADVVEAGSLVEAKARLAAEAFDLLLLDLSLGDQFSLTALPQLRESRPEMRIIVLTSMAEALYAERALRAGADGFVMKSELSDSLLAAVDSVLAGHVHVSTALSDAMLRRSLGRDTRAQRPELSTREVEVLRLVAAGKTTREIADALNRSVKTIETHKQALKAKLGAHSPASLVRMAVAWCGESS